jgi:plastocyanin
MGAFVAAIIAVSACGGAGTGPSTAPPIAPSSGDPGPTTSSAPSGETVEITVGTDTGAELKFDPAQVTIQAGTTVRVTFENRSSMPHNLTFQAAYTFSKAIDTTSEATFVGAGDSNQTGNDARSARALSRFHTPHRFTFFGTYRTPWFSNDRGLAGQVLGGWQFSTVVKLAKGTPFTVVTTGVDLNLDGFSESRPILLDPSVLGRSVADPATATISLPSSAFRQLTIADRGAPILGRNTFFGDGVRNVDFGIFKNFPMPWEGHRLTLRADMFNAFNHVQYGIPSALITNTNFGAITGLATQYAPRSIQVSLRYQY